MPMTHPASSQDGFATLNARYIDLTIHRWEVLLELHIGERWGTLGGEDGAPTAEQLGASLEEVDRELDRVRREGRAAGRAFPLDQVVVSYGLDPIETQILQLAVMPHLDLAFRSRIARYNNNILYDFVDVDFILNLLFPSRHERLQARAYFAADAPLIAQRLLSFAPAKDPKGTGLLAQELRPPERLADYLLCRRALDPALKAYAELLDPPTRLEEVALSPDDRDDLVGILRHFDATLSKLGRHEPGQTGPFPVGEGLAVAFVGPSGTGKTMLAEALSNALSRPLIKVDAGRLASVSDRFGQLAEDLFNEARVQGAVLLFDRCEPLLAKGSPKLPTLLAQLERFGGLVVLTTNRPDELDTGVERYVAWQLNLDMPGVDQRLHIWQGHVPPDVTLADDVDLDDMATRFEITGGQIRSSWLVARKRALASREAPGVVTQPMLKAAASGQLRANMEDYSVRSKVSLTLDDLILPEKELVLIREVLAACQNRVFVMSKWGFGKRLVTGKGICVLFKGDPGTGKTLCAEILASELGMKLYQISIPKIVSKYIGETEKNIAKIFSTARANHSMLLFDEADSLFTKRVSVENAIDRFSNMETNLLLQEIERFEGITILTTNLDKNIDDAFARRIQFKIDFPFPDPDHRTLIWKSLVPKECPIEPGVDFEELGYSFELSGGFIKNAVVRAAYRAASRGDKITFADIEFAAEQECKSAGKLFRATGAREEW